MWENLIEGFGFALQPINILCICAGVFIGIIVGALPGVSPSVGLAVMIPFTFSLPPATSLLLLGSIYCGGMFGGSISAILLRTPGSGAAAATVFDGYELTRQGKAGKALGMSLFASTLGGIFSVIVLMTLAPQLAKVAIKFGPPEYFALASFGLCIVARLSVKNMAKGLISTFLGLFIATIGIDAISGYERYTFGFNFLFDGINFIPVLVGLFAASEVYKRLSTIREEKVNYVASVATELPNKQEMLECLPAIGRSSIIGTFIGILPGAGGTIASFIAYNEAIRFSKHPERFGKGSLEGIAAPEAANNAASGGAMVPLLALGIPGSSAAAIMMGAFLIHGLQAGPLLFTNQKELVYTFFAGLFIAQFVMFGLGYFSNRVFSRVIGVPYELLGPIILVYCSVGAFVADYNITAILIMFVFGIVGYFMSKYGFPTAPTVLALILGPLMETSFRRALIITGGNALTFLQRPITLVLLVLSAISILSPVIESLRKNKKSSSNNA